MTRARAEFVMTTDDLNVGRIVESDCELQLPNSQLVIGRFPSHEPRIQYSTQYNNAQMRKANHKQVKIMCNSYIQFAITPQSIQLTITITKAYCIYKYKILSLGQNENLQPNNNIGPHTRF